MKIIAWLFLALYIVPPMISAALYIVNPRRTDWRSADRSTAHVLPPIANHPDAVAAVHLRGPPIHRQAVRRGDLENCVDARSSTALLRTDNSVIMRLDTDKLGAIVLDEEEEDRSSVADLLAEIEEAVQRR